MTDTENLPALPEKWCWTTLETSVDIFDNQRIPINSNDREKRKGNIPYYGATGQVGWINDYLFDEELVLLGEDGAPFLDFNKSKAYIVKGKSWVNNHAHVLRAVDRVLINKFLCHYLNTFDYHQYVTGTTRLKLNQSSMRKIPIILPPLPEQNRIVLKIEELFTYLDAGVQELEKAKVQVKNYRQAVLKAAFEGKLTKTLREEILEKAEPACTLVEKIVREQKTIGKKLEDYKLEESNLPRIPTTWTWTYIGNIFEVKPGGTPSRKKPEYWNGNIPWVSSGEVANCILNGTQEFITQLGVENSNAKTNPPGTVLLAMIGEGKTRGQVAILNIEAATNQNVAAIRCASTSVLSKYVFFWLQSRYEKNRTRGSGGMQQALNARIIKEMPIPISPIEEQKIIVSEIERRFSVIDQIEKTIDQSLAQAEKLRQSILKKAFEGKLVPQDPNDEPASVLLERIKQEKGRAESRKKPGKRRKVKAETKMEVSGKIKQAELF